MDKFELLAEKFVEYLEIGKFDKAFHFALNDGVNDIEFGTVCINEFETTLFVTGIYGDNSLSGTESILKFEDVSEDYADKFDYILNYFYENYKDWEPVV